VTKPDDALSRAFEVHRPRLLRVAYATVGSVYEAEDCVQEAWLRLQAQDPASIRDLGAWLTTTVSRLAYDALGSARARRERYVGPWLPEPLVEGLADNDPADRVTLDESVSMALLVVLERLSPAERTAFLLHDVFGLAFEEVAGVVGRTPPRYASSPPGPAGTSKTAGPGFRPRWRSSAGWSPRSRMPAKVATLSDWSRCSTPAWCGAPTVAARSPRPTRPRPVRGTRRAGCSHWPGGRPAACAWPWSTVPRAW
jgi:RNA polymerase sigma factor (sigma-70 family)